GEQLALVAAPRRRLVELGVGVDDPDDLARIAAQLAKLGVAAELTPSALTAVDPGTQLRVVAQVAPRIRQKPAPAAAMNTPGHDDRVNSRAAAVLREQRVRPRKFGPGVAGCTS